MVTSTINIVANDLSLYLKKNILKYKMSQSVESNPRSGSSQTQFEFEDNHDDVQTTDRLFDKFPSYCPIKQRIEYCVMRYNNNLYLGKTYQELEEVPFVCRPVQKVTEELLKKFVTYVERSNKKKLAWVYDRKDEPFCAEFKSKLDSSEFRSVREAELLASKIYSEHCPKYQSGKAIVSSERGQRVYKKRLQSSNEVHETQLEEFKARMLEKLQQSQMRFQEIVKLKTNEANESVDFAKTLFKNEVTNLPQRVGVNCLSVVYDLIKNL